MTDVFISYSRKDRCFAERLHHALAVANRDAWIDWINIPESAEWWKEIQRGIEAADTFVFILSPDSAVSKVCGDEIDHAVRHNKRLVPVVWREGFDPGSLHEALGRHNWLFFRESDDFEQRFYRLIEVIDTDLTHTRTHTRLLLRTLEWEEKGRNDSFLLRGDDLTDAERWLTESKTKTPEATEQQKNYIAKSREAEDATRRIMAAGSRATRRLRVAGIAMVVSLLALAGTGVMAVLAYRQLNESKIIARIERESSFALQQFEDNQLEGLVTAMKATQQLKRLVKNHGKYPTAIPLLNLRTLLDRIQEQNQFRGHWEENRIASFSPDGQLIATAGTAGKVWLWSIDGKQLLEFRGHSRIIYSVRFSPDGRQIATAGADGLSRLWNVDGRLQSVFKGHQKRIWDVNFSPDGRQIVTAGEDGTVRLWNLDGEQLAKWNGHQGGVRSVNFSRDGQQIVTVGDDGTARLWSTDGQQLVEFKGHRGWVRGVSFSPNGQQIATAGDDGTARLWTINGKQLLELKSHQGGVVNNVSFSPDGRRIATVGEDGTAQLWTVEGQRIATFKGHERNVYSVSFSPDGWQMVTAGEDGTARLWRIAGHQTITFKGHQGWISNVSFSPDGKQIVSVGRDGTARLWNIDTRQVMNFKVSHAQLWSVAFRPMSADPLIKINSQFATTGKDGIVRLWGVNGERLMEFKGHQGWVWGVSFSPDGKRIATAGQDGTVRIWSLDGTELVAFKGHQGEGVSSVSFGSNGQQLVTGGADGIVRLWNLEGRQLAELKGHQGWIRSVSFSPDGKYVASAGSDDIARLWRVDGAQVSELIGHYGEVRSISFSSDGQQVVTAGNDGTARFWSLDGNQIAEIQVNQGWVNDASFSPDSKQIATAGIDGVVRMFPAQNLDDLLKRGCGQLQLYFMTHPAQLEALEACHTDALLKDAAFGWIREGESEAALGNEAIALNLFHKALRWNPDLNFDPQAKVFQAAAPSVVREGVRFAQAGDIKKALEQFAQTQKRDPDFTISVNAWNVLCWQGSLRGHASDVLEACEKAVAFDPSDGGIRDSRGLARALTGDQQGAIADFEAFILWTTNEADKAERRRWIEALSKGHNPFTEAVMQQLRKDEG